MIAETLLDKAIIFAADKHKGSLRKGDGQPYIFHPIEVLSIASLLTKDSDILCAAVLHDTIEDTDATKEDIENLFNKKIAEIVADESEDKRGNVNKDLTWELRKLEAINRIKNSNNRGTKIVCLADKVSNLRSLNRLVLTIGDAAWENFNMKDPLKHYWYYDELKKALSEFENESAYKEYCFLVDALFNRYLKEDKNEK